MLLFKFFDLFSFGKIKKDSVNWSGGFIVKMFYSLTVGTGTNGKEDWYESPGTGYLCTNRLGTKCSWVRKVRMLEKPRFTSSTVIRCNPRFKCRAISVPNSSKLCSTLVLL